MAVVTAGRSWWWYCVLTRALWWQGSACTWTGVPTTESSSIARTGRWSNPGSRRGRRDSSEIPAEAGNIKT
eukprot:1756177-Rhodomonas_salina.1